MAELPQLNDAQRYFVEEFVMEYKLGHMSRRDMVARVLPEHAEQIRQLLFDPMSGEDLSAFGAVLGRVRDHMRAAPPRSAKPRAGRNRTD